MKLLTNAYRPTTFSDLVGQNSARMILQALVFSGDVPPSLLFGGTRGSGKTSAARVLAAALNCENPSNGNNCAECSSCVATRTGASLAVHEIDAASHGGVDEIRALKEMSQFSSGARWRVILLDEAHMLSKAACNALLKVLEEPPPFTTFVLLTTEPDRIIDTVRSRSMPIEFHPVPPSVIKERLEKICASEGLEFEPEVLEEIAAESGGGLRDAVMLLDQARLVRAFDLKSLRSLTGKTDTAHQLVQAVVTSDHATANQTLQSFFTQSGDTAGLITDLIEEFQSRFRLNTISTPQMLKAVKLLWDGRTISNGPSRESRLQMEALVTLLYGVFYTPTAPAPILSAEDKSQKSPPKTNGHPRLSLEEMVAIAGGG